MTVEAVTLPAVLVPRDVHDAIVNHARFCTPQEACGLVAVDGAGQLRMAYCLTNIEASPTNYTLDPTEHYRAMRHAERHGWEIGAVFHSHVNSAAYPSQSDVAGALEPAWLYLIVSLRGAEPELRGFHIDHGTVTEAQLALPSAWHGRRANGT